MGIFFETRPLNYFSGVIKANKKLNIWYILNMALDTNDGAWKEKSIK